MIESDNLHTENADGEKINSQNQETTETPQENENPIISDEQPQAEEKPEETAQSTVAEEEAKPEKTESKVPEDTPAKESTESVSESKEIQESETPDNNSEDQTKPAEKEVVVAEEKTEAEETSNIKEEVGEAVETKKETEDIQESKEESTESVEMGKTPEKAVESREETEESAKEELKETAEVKEATDEAGEAKEEPKETVASDDEAKKETEKDKEEEIPLKNYDELPIAVLIGEAKSLLNNHPAHKLREHFGQIRDAARRIFEEEEEAKKEAFLEDGGNEIDFQYSHPQRGEFHKIYGDYKGQLNTYYKEREKEQEKNLQERLEITDQLKALYTEPNDSNSDIFKKYRELKERWHNAGFVPRAEARNVFRNYYHHLNNFYKYLDLNKELRELDYGHNLEVRKSIISRAEQLVKEKNLQKALNELQYLHRLWKENAVPVAEEFREPTWQRFKELTNEIHDRKTELNEKQKAIEEENLLKKRKLLEEMAALSEDADKKEHRQWQKGIKRLNQLRKEFIAVGRVPREFNQKLWDEFKEKSRAFNHKKNDFYKRLKSEQQKNLEEKQKLLEIAKEHRDSNDWNESVQVMKRIQADWKKIGHVPRKYSDQIWKDFKEACNHFFDNYKARREGGNQNYEENLSKKEALLAELQDFKLSEDAQADLNKINEYNIEWNSIGKVPASKMDINKDFNKKINELIKSLGLSQPEIQDFI